LILDGRRGINNIDVVVRSYEFFVKPGMYVQLIDVESFSFYRSLDESLQKTFHRYLEIRGIKPSTLNFLHEYMIDKDSKEYLVWLNKVKNFIQA
jgi:Tfp pilus assembly PilM family ATPase